MSRNRPPATVDTLRDSMRAAGLRGIPMLSKYDGECGWCGQALLRGDVIAWMPADKCALCAGCAAEGEQP